MEVRPVAQRVHLVDTHRRQFGGVGLDLVEQGHRLAVGQRDDHVAADVLQHRLRADRRCGAR